ncbi:hypothetical protein [Roseiarcus fermentans]|uniref:hypothetical protein n=1 Tax=Roseiarcus fermentans TaxID=1473586 RepID=UPI0014752424|nr:hypothetical protein [Roseiarcus fermentans]
MVDLSIAAPVFLALRPVFGRSRGAAYDNGHNKKRETWQSARFRAAEQGSR